MKILLLAGEESGVLYANRIRAEALEAYPNAEIRGYGDYGFRIADLAVMGIGQVLRKFFYFLRVKRTMERAIAEWKPDVVCTVDYPGMNLRLARFAKARGCRAVHVVCPQVWAWKRGRIPKIEASLDRLCCFFPFEPALFKPGFAEFVGHPLAESFQTSQSNNRLTEKANNQILLAVLPGSRMGEIEKHMPVLLAVIRRLRGAANLPGGGLRAVIPAANERAFRTIERMLARGAADGVELVRGGARDVLRQADAAVVASGTATLEAALVGCPTVLVYRVGWLFAAIARRVIKGVKHIGLANIIAEKAGRACPMKEFLQEDFTVENVIGALLPLLTDRQANDRARAELAGTMELMKTKTGGGAISRIVRQFLADRQHSNI